MKFTAILFVFLIVPVLLYGQWGGGEKYPDLKPHPESMKKWQDMKFGMFVHWGPSVIRGTSSWARGNHPYDFAPRIPISEYDSLYVQFNPLLFDAADWISTAKSAGMKYFVMVTKHHDGFCNWDSRFTDYDIMSTPYKKDVLMDLSKECQKQDILFGTYYSICDWHHPDYPGRYGGDPRPPASSDMEKYMAYMTNQLDELIHKYHSQIMWFDGYWEGPWTHERGMDLYKHLRDQKNDLLINNRVDRMRADEEGKIHPQKYAGDYKTPEQEIGAFDIENPWESCVTISDGWFYKPHGRLKSLHECISLLVQTVGGGGNLLFNIGPMADGRMELFQKKRLLEMGRWLDKYGESIYGTKGGPFQPSKFTASTTKGNRIFLHVLDWPADRLTIPEIGVPVKRCYLFDGGELKLFAENDSTYTLAVEEEHRQNPNTIIVLEFDKAVESLPALQAVIFKDLKTAELKEKPAQKFSADGPQTLIDGKRGTLNMYEKWLGFESADLEVVIDLQQEKNIRQIRVGYLENQNDWLFAPTAVKCAISLDNKNFENIAVEQIPIKRTTDNKIGEVVLDFAPVKTRYVRVKAKNTAVCPDWHKGAGGKAWLFIDEIILE